MAFPQIVTSNNSITATNQTNHTMLLPGSIVAGRTLLGIFGADNGPTIAFPGGWNKVLHLSNPSVGTSVGLAWRKADGGEGASITVVTGNAQQSSHFTYQIGGAADPSVQPPEVSTGVGSAASVNPNSDSLTPTGGAKDYLWFTVEANDDAHLVTVYPTNYSNGQTQQSSAPGGGGTNLGVARRELNAVSEDPGAFTIAASQDWAAFTVVLHPVLCLNKINIGDAWKEACSMKVNIGDNWKDVAGMKMNIGDTWKDIF